jgi:hypothetical protein
VRETVLRGTCSNCGEESDLEVSSVLLVAREFSDDEHLDAPAGEILWLCNRCDELSEVTVDVAHVVLLRSLGVRT